MTSKWPIETTIKFLREYRIHQCLWDFDSVAYKDKNKRDAAYHSLVSAMNIPDFGVVEVKNKIKNLRSTFNQEKKKVQDSKRSGTGKPIYISPLKWLKELEPTMYFSKKRTTIKNIKVEEWEEEEVCVGGDESNGGSFQASVDTCVPSTSSSYSPPKKRCNKRQLIDVVDDLQSLEEAVNADDDEGSFEAFGNRVVEDSFEAFGNSVVVQLRKLSEERALLAQRDIQNILTVHGIENIRTRKTNKH